MRPAPRHVHAAVGLLAALLAATGCSDDYDDQDSSPSPSATGGSVAVTEGQAGRALITGTSLPAEWSPTRGDDPHDDLLDGRTDEAGCESVLDDADDGELVNADAKADADRRFADRDEGGVLSYRVAAYTKGQAESGVAGLRRLPQECDRFTVTSDDGRSSVVQVTRADPPKSGEESAGVRLTLATRVDGEPAKLTMDLAAVRIGPNLITVTNGSLDGADSAATRRAVINGTQRLKDVLARKSPTSPTYED